MAIGTTHFTESFCVSHFAQILIRASERQHFQLTKVGSSSTLQHETSLSNKKMFNFLALSTVQIFDTKKPIPLGWQK